jgi:DNA-binding transcriptional regulator YiaG
VACTIPKLEQVMHRCRQDIGDGSLDGGGADTSSAATLERRPSRRRVGTVTVAVMEQKRNSMYFSRAEVKRFEHEFVSTEEAAGILQINELTVQSWTRKGRLHPVSGPGVDDRAAYLFHREEVERLRLENRCTAPEMSARLGISRSQLRIWIEQGKVKPISGPGIDQCGRYLFALDEMRGQC